MSVTTTTTTTTTRFAALNVLDGTVTGRNMQRHRHQEVIRFLNAIEAQVPARQAIHAIVDNYATHKHPKVRQWLFRPLDLPLHPDFGILAQRCRGLLRQAHQASIEARRLPIGRRFASSHQSRFVAEHTVEPKPFTSTADPNKIIQAARRGHQVLDSIH